MSNEDAKLADDVRAAFREVSAAVTRAANAGLIVVYETKTVQSVGDAAGVPVFSVSVSRPV